MFVALFILAVAAALILVGCKATRAGYEPAPYKVVRSSGKFEVRDYAALTVVETSMAGGGDASNGSLNRLFRFITGGNEAKQKIAMTTPVFMSGSDSNATMAFVLPAKYKASGAPNPTDGAVKVRELEAGLLQLSCDLKHGILIACRQHYKTAFYRLLPRARR